MLAKKNIFIHLAISDTHLPNSQIIVKYGIKRRHAFSMQLQSPSTCFLLAGGAFQTCFAPFGSFRFLFGRCWQSMARYTKSKLFHYIKAISTLGWFTSQKNMFIHLAISDTHLPNSQIIVKYVIKRRPAFTMQLQSPSICVLLAGGAFQTSFAPFGSFRFLFGRCWQSMARPIKSISTYFLQANNKVGCFASHF